MRREVTVLFEMSGHGQIADQPRKVWVIANIVDAILGVVNGPRASIMFSVGLCIDSKHGVDFDNVAHKSNLRSESEVTVHITILPYILYLLFSLRNLWSVCYSLPFKQYFKTQNGHVIRSPCTRSFKLTPM